jgi:hypothetical protein
MLRHLKLWIGLLSVMAVVPRDYAFTLWTSPMQTFQTAALCYGPRYWYNSTAIYITNRLAPILPGNVGYTEQGGPAITLLQGSRLNVGITTYAYDPSFVAYYGADGMKAVDAAFAILNSLPAASSANLSQFITQGNEQINYTARALSMLDLKSTVLQLMIEHLGLLGETHVFDMYGQQTIPGAGTCASAYFVGVDNFDPVTWNPSTYVNGILYGYNIQDGCSAGLLFTDAMEEADDEPGSSTAWTAVATQEGLQVGGYYLGITRDDMGGLSCLYSKNNFRYETMFTDVYPGQESVLNSPFNPLVTNSTATNTLPTLVGGVEKVNFYRVYYNPPITTTNVLSYTIPSLTNNKIQTVVLYRTNTVPDIIISATNLLATTATQIQDTPFTRTYAWLTSPQASYPSVMSPTMSLVINDVGPLSVNESPNFMQGSALFIYPFFQYGSFDGSTNPPIVFPTGTSIAAVTANLLTPPSGQGAVNSPFNPLVTNTVTASGTTGGTVTGGGSTAFTPTQARPGGGNAK